MASQRPQCLHVDDYAAAEPARQRLAQKHRFPFLRSLRISSSLPSLSKKTPRRLRPHNSIIHDSAVEPIQVHSDLPTIPLIQLDTSAVDQGDEGQNLYCTRIKEGLSRIFSFFSSRRSLPLLVPLSSQHLITPVFVSSQQTQLLSLSHRLPQIVPNNLMSPSHVILSQMVTGAGSPKLG